MSQIAVGKVKLNTIGSGLLGEESLVSPNLLNFSDFFNDFNNILSDCDNWTICDIKLAILDRKFISSLENKSRRSRRD